MRPFPFPLTAIHLAMAGVALWSPGHALAGDMSASCPLRLAGTVVKADKPVEGWITTVAEQLHLTGAGMLAGAPETKMYLVPQKDTKTTQTYAFSKGEGERWLWCSYGGAGGIELARKLDDKATTCTITSKKKADNTLSASVACR